MSDDTTSREQACVRWLQAGNRQATAGTGFNAGWDARDAEVAALTAKVAQLRDVGEQILKASRDWGRPTAVQHNAGCYTKNRHCVVDEYPYGDCVFGLLAALLAETEDVSRG